MDIQWMVGWWVLVHSGQVSHPFPYIQSSLMASSLQRPSQLLVPFYSGNFSEIFLKNFRVLLSLF
jgi:hypothetical protein